MRFEKMLDSVNKIRETLSGWSNDINHYEDALSFCDDLREIIGIVESNARPFLVAEAKEIERDAYQTMHG